MLNNFIYAQTKDLFLEALGEGNVLDEAIVFIEDTKEIWNHGHYFGGGSGSGVDSSIISELQTAVSQLEADKLDTSTAESTYAKKSELPNLSGYLTQTTADTLYATISSFNGLQEEIDDLITTVSQKANSSDLDNYATSDRVTTLENYFSTAEDSDATINKWHEIVAFLEGTNEGSTVESLLAAKANQSALNDLQTSIAGLASESWVTSNFLGLGGGKISGLLTIRRNPPVIRFEYSAEYLLGFLGFDMANRPIFIENDGETVYALLHSGNIGDYALKLDGQSVLNGSLNFRTGDTIYRFANDSLGNASWYNGSSWKTIAFTDSNVASATKLQTARTIWGQSFDGTGDISRAPSFPSFIDVNRNAETGALLDSSIIGFEIQTYANDARLKTYTASGGSNPAHLVLTSSGNVGIGTTSPAFKLDVYNNATTDYDFHIYNDATKFSFYAGKYGLWYGTGLDEDVSIFTIQSACQYDGGGGRTEFSVDGLGNATARNAFRLSGAGQEYSGLFVNSRITGGYATDLWLYNEQRLILYGTEILMQTNASIAGNLTASGEITAPTFNGNLNGSASKVNGYSISVVSSMPSSPDANTIYYVTG